MVSNIIKMNKKILLTIFLAAIVMISNVQADETLIEDITETERVPEVEEVITKPKLSPQEKAVRKKKKKSSMNKLEGCLIMVRAFYG